MPHKTDTDAFRAAASTAAIDTDYGKLNPMDATKPRPLVIPDGKGETWEDVYRFWFGCEGVPRPDYSIWFGCGPDVDAVIREKFQDLLERAGRRELESWKESPRSCVAYLVLVDQFPRHIFRGTSRVYDFDHLGLEANAKLREFMAQGVPLHIEEALIAAWPWMHSEDKDDAQAGIDWVAGLAERVKDDSTLKWVRMVTHVDGAERHVYVVHRFGRYPHRNRLLDRESTPEEVEYLERVRPVWGMDQWPDHVGGSRRDHLQRARYFGEMLRWGFANRYPSVVFLASFLVLLNLGFSIFPSPKRQYVRWSEIEAEGALYGAAVAAK